MISLKVDEGYAFDYLAILDIKSRNNIGGCSITNFQNCLSDLHGQVGDKMNSILSSEEYKSLVSANGKTFEAVQLARYGEISAKEVDNLNMLRFLAKNALQKRFFPESSISEVKT